jgi:hypothetical protein
MVIFVQAVFVVVGFRVGDALTRRFGKKAPVDPRQSGIFTPQNA